MDNKTNMSSSQWQQDKLKNKCISKLKLNKFGNKPTSKNWLDKTRFKKKNTHNGDIENKIIQKAI